MGTTLMGLPASHPTVTAQLMLDRKGIPYRRIDLLPAVHRLILRGLGFPDVTVPAIRLDGVRLQGTRRISRALDALQPEPPLFPHDPERRARTEEAEAWGDEVLQPAARRLAWAALRRDHSTVDTFLTGGYLPVPTPVAVATAGPLIALSAYLNRATDEATRQDLERLPAMLDRVEALLEQGVLGGLVPNAAGYQVAPSVRILMALDDLRPFIEQRPAGRFAAAVIPEPPGRVPAVLPPGWLAPLRAESP
jgi:glutathione S-transferase